MYVCMYVLPQEEEAEEECVGQNEWQVSIHEVLLMLRMRSLRVSQHIHTYIY